MCWTEIENKAQTYVVLRGNVDGNTFFEELKANKKKEIEENISFTKVILYFAQYSNIRISTILR